MMSFIPSTHGLRGFEAAGRHLSFTKAAEELGLTQAAISYRIAELEKSLGLQLFQRNGRSLSLTSAGQAYLPIVRDALHRLEHGTAELIERRRTGSKVIRVLTMQAFASLWLIPRLSRFRALQPDIEVQVVSGIGGFTHIDRHALEQQEIDAAIILASSQAQFGDLSICSVAEDFALPVLSPTLMGAETRISSPEHLTRHLVLHALTWPDIWSRWLDGVGHTGLRFRAEMHLQNTALTTQAAMSGLGAAMAHAPLVEHFLASGVLVAPFDCRLATGCSYFLASRGHSSTIEPVALFRDWVIAEMGGTFGASPSHSGGLCEVARHRRQKPRTSAIA